MCGICGIWNTNGRPVDKDRVQNMARSLARRGPDGDGFFFEGPLGLGHRRLAIIDLETGAQPLYNEDKTIVVVFNGEIYNYVELRAELQAGGHRFATESDTETIVHAYEEWGRDCVHHFNGMWAFALWDKRARGLFVSRDRVGEKPLFYHYDGKQFAFASEIKGLVAADIPTEPALELVSVFLCLGYIPAPDSFYRAIKKLKPGHSLWITPAGLTDWCYWSLPVVREADMKRDAKKAQAGFARLFEDAVRLRLRSDVSFGAFLSGGLDSSSITAVMSRLLPAPVQTFTIGFPEAEFDERPLARLVADKFHTAHHEYVIGEANFDDNLAFVLDCYDEPFGDSSAIPSSAVAACARKNVKMVLTGDGGDEVLSGYPAYQVEKAMGLYGPVPAPLKTLVGACWNSLGPLLRRNALFFNRIKRMLSSMKLSFIDRLMEKTCVAPPALVSALVTGFGSQIDPHDYLADRLSQDPYRDPFYRLMHFHFSTSLPDDMLAKVDRASMYHSLEVRLPFLDYRLVEFASGLHKSVKMAGFQRKTLLRQSSGRLLPAALKRARKRGFSVPVRQWWKEARERDRLFSLGKSSLAGFQQEVLADLIGTHLAGHRDFGQFFWMIQLLEAWLKPGRAQTLKNG